MNKVNKLLLKTMLLPKALYKKWGCNIKQLEAIITLKLMMDDRRPRPLAALKKKKEETKKAISNATIWGMIGSLVMGSFFLIFFSFDNDITSFTLFFTSFCSLLALTLISDFTNVLLDIRDNFIILPKPVNDRTFVLARLLHIIIHISKMILPLTLPALILIAVTKSVIGLLLMLPLIVLATLLTVFIVNAFYILVLKITTPEKFKNIISYIQIVFAIGVYAGSQILPRQIGKMGGSFNVSTFGFTKFFPTYWFAQCWNALYTGVFTGHSIIYILLATLFPIVCIYVVIKYFAPSFNQKLSQISGSSGESAPAKVSKEKPLKRKYSDVWANLLTEKGVERMGFLFTWKMMKRSRDFKMKVYPGIGYMIVLMVVMFMQKKNFSFSQLQQNMQSQNGSGKIAILMIIYFSSLMISTAIGGIVMSDKYKASWLYFTTPIYEPGKIMVGAVKAVAVMFFFPFVVLALLAGISLIGFSILPNILLACINQIVIIGIFSVLGTHYLPFSSSINKPSFTTVLKNIFSLVLASFIGILHYFVYNKTYIVFVLIIVGCFAAYFLFRSIGKYSWQKIITVYTEE